MVNEGKGRLFRRRDGKFLVYLPKDLCEDSVFPFKDSWQLSRKTGRKDSIPVTVSFVPSGPKQLLIEVKE